MTDNGNDTTKFHPKIRNALRASPQFHPMPPPIISSSLTCQRTEEKPSEIRITGRVRKLPRRPRLHSSEHTGSGSSHWSDLDPLSRYSRFFTFAHIVPDVVGTMGMSSASVGMDHGIWNCGASSRIMVFLEGETLRSCVEMNVSMKLTKPSML